MNDRLQLFHGLLQIPIGIVIRRLDLKLHSDERMPSLEFNGWLAGRISSGLPTAVVRFGGTEMKSLRKYGLNQAFGLHMKYDSECTKLCNLSGFYPNDPSSIERFCELYINLLPEMDAVGNWDLAFERYFIGKYTDIDRLVQTDLENLEPYNAPTSPWSSALKDKKVLVIHPFAESILNQYQNKRLELFPGNNNPGMEILPEFELHCLKSVQSLGGVPDQNSIEKGLDNWFKAYEYMLDEAMKIDFDVAILGCGAYGMPLALRLKQEGKIAIHMGGATQMMFGVYGKRWENNQSGLINEAWIRPLETERSQNFNHVENGCYW